MHAGRQCAPPAVRLSRLRVAAMRAVAALSETVSVTLRVLIIDDNLRFLEAARSSLERQGVRVVGVAATAAEALAQAEALEPDVALVDIGLGDESGFELTHRLVGRFPHLRGCVVLISTRAGDDYADMVESSAAVGFISKSHLSARAIGELLSCGGAGEGAGEVDEPSGLPGT
jgi:two-component system, NarL family, nitrate/nitrite response regulator NarL